MTPANSGNFITPRIFFFAAGAIILIAIAACGKNDGRVKVYPVNGKLIIRGAPAEGARVVFYPVSDELKKPGMPIPYGLTDAQGVYKLRSYDPDDGAPEGEYKVGVVWTEPIASNSSPDAEPKSHLDRRFADPQKSQLTATVPRGGGEIPVLEIQ
jgi:hypothetical protein